TYRCFAKDKGEVCTRRGHPFSPNRDPCGATVAFTGLEERFTGRHADHETEWPDLLTQDAPSVAVLHVSVSLVRLGWQARLRTLRLPLRRRGAGAQSQSNSIGCSSHDPGAFRGGALCLIDSEITSTIVFHASGTRSLAQLGR
ncbi:hypothetical protein BaRGS_00005978, partial [Batillaria attramentaria]